MTRLLIADDHEVVRAGLRQILQSHPGWEIVSEAHDGKEAVLKAIETKPDVAIIDYSLPLMNGIEVTRQIRARLHGTEVLIFTMHDSDTLVEQLLNAGARGYLLKSDANKNLVEAVESLINHKPFFTSKLSSAVGAAQPKPGDPSKSRRVEGQSNACGHRELVVLLPAFPGRGFH